MKSGGEDVPHGGEIQLDELVQEATGGQTVFKSVEDLRNSLKIEEAVRRTVARLRPRALEMWRKFLDSGSKDIAVIEDLARDARANPQDIFLEWLVQRMLFLEMGKHFRLESVDHFPSTQPDCALVLTRSSSIIVAGKLDPSDGRRDVDYVRIDSCKATWDQSFKSFRAEMDTLDIGDQARFRQFLTSSPVRNILVLPADRSQELEVIKRGTLDSLHTVSRAVRAPARK